MTHPVWMGFGIQREREKKDRVGLGEKKPRVDPVCALPNTCPRNAVGETLNPQTKCSRNATGNVTSSSTGRDLRIESDPTSSPEGHRDCSATRHLIYLENVCKTKSSAITLSQ